MTEVATEDEVGDSEQDDSAVEDRGPRRFALAAAAGVIAASIPYLWVLMDDWTGTFNPARSIVFFSNYYDLQAKAIMHGRLSVPTGSLGIEGFIHDGRTYTYFGLLPSLLRIPFLLLRPSLAGSLTALSMLVAWLLTGLFASLLIWRVRVLVRGSAELGWAEAVSLGALLVTIMCGSVLLYLASAPWVYDEDVAWAIFTTVAVLFVLLGILDRPSYGRVIAAGALLVAAALGRPPAALACIFGTLLVAGWLYLGRGDADGRRQWALPVSGVALLSLAVLFTCNYVKFGTLINGLPLADQVWTRLNEHRRLFLAATGNKGYSFHLIPTTVWTYFQPFGLRVQSAFPFFALPVQSPHVFGGYIVDILYPTASVPASMPLLFLLSCWAVVQSFQRNAGHVAKLFRIPLLAAAGATAVDYELGYIAPRYLGDFLPFLVLGGAFGLIDLWRRSGAWSSQTKRTVASAFLVLALFSVAANVGIAISSNTQWSPTQAANYIRAVNAVGNLTGNHLHTQVQRGSALPFWAPANEVFIVGNCDGLYVSTGVHLGIVPTFQTERDTWTPVELEPEMDTSLVIVLNAKPSTLGTGVPLVSFGLDTIYVRSGGLGTLRFVLDDPRYPQYGPLIKAQLGVPYYLNIVTNTIQHVVTVNIGFNFELNGELSGAGLGAPVVVHTRPPSAHGRRNHLVVERLPAAPSDLSLCRSLLKGR
jgi:hypothetical protein